MTDPRNNTVVDLTDSFMLADHRDLSNVIIDLVTDDSITAFTPQINENHRRISRRFNPNVRTSTPISNDNTARGLTPTSANTRRLGARGRQSVIKKQLFKQKKSVKTIKNNVNLSPKSTKNKSSIGECPICWDELGTNPLVSTKCGHVFCQDCLENSLKHVRKCPCCRRMLKGSTAYHPLYNIGKNK